MTGLLKNVINLQYAHKKKEGNPQEQKSLLKKLTVNKSKLKDLFLESNIIYNISCY